MIETKRGNWYYTDLKGVRQKFRTLEEAEEASAGAVDPIEDFLAEIEEEDEWPSK